MKNLTLTILLAFILLPTPERAHAWLLQPPIPSEDFDNEVQEFSELSAAALEAFADFHAKLAAAEINHAPINSEDLLVIAGNISDISSGYKELSKSNLYKMPLNWTSLADISKYLADEQRIQNALGIKITSAADLSTGLSNNLASLSSDIEDLAESGLTPNSPIQEQINGRILLSGIVTSMARFVRFGNAGAAAIRATIE